MTAPGHDTSLLSPNTVPCEGITKSTLYTMIPSVVRSRIPVLASLRHSAKPLVLSARNSNSLTRVNSRKEKEPHGFVATVPNSRATTPTLRPETPEPGVHGQEVGLHMLPQLETRSGVDWDVAATGVRLWVNAKAQAEQGRDSAALRSMHIDALRYMHMALPSDLTPVEIDSLRASMSPQLIFSSTDIKEFQFTQQQRQQQRQRNILRQGVAQFVCWLFAGILLILPIVMAFLNRLLQFEREHQVTERVMTNGLDFTSALGERGLELQKAFLRFKDGRVGGACVDAGSWFVEGIFGGVNDGLDAIAQSRRKP